MAANWLEIDTKVVSRIQDASSKLGSASVGESPARLDAIAQARAEYEQSFPLEKVVQVAGAGAFDYLVSANFAGYVDGWSNFLQIVYPYDATDQILEGLDAEDYGLVRLPAGLYLRFMRATPAAGENFLAWYTAQHTLTAATSTIPPAHDDALAELAASYCCEKLASIYAQSIDATLQADTVDRRGVVDYYRSLAKDLRKTFEAMAAVSPPSRAGLAVADLNPSFSGGERLLFHD